MEKTVGTIYLARGDEYSDIHYLISRPRICYMAAGRLFDNGIGKQIIVDLQVYTGDFTEPLIKVRRY